MAKPPIDADGMIEVKQAGAPGNRGNVKGNPNAKLTRRMTPEMRAMNLTPMRARFAEEYCVDFNATQAAIRAGYAPGSALSASQFLSLPSVQVEIQRQMKARSERTHITQDAVLQELASIIFFDVRKCYNKDGTLKNIGDLDDATARALAGIETQEKNIGSRQAPDFVTIQKLKLPDKVTAIGLAMRHLGLLQDKRATNLPLMPPTIIFMRDSVQPQLTNNAVIIEAESIPRSITPEPSRVPSLKIARQNGNSAK